MNDLQQLVNQNCTSPTYFKVVWYQI